MYVDSPYAALLTNNEACFADIPNTHIAQTMHQATNFIQSPPIVYNMNRLTISTAPNYPECIRHGRN